MTRVERLRKLRAAVSLLHHGRRMISHDTRARTSMDDASRPPDFGLAKTLIAIGYVECLGLVKDARARRALALRLQQDGYGALNSIADVARQMAFSTQRVKQFIAMALDDVCDCMKEIEAMVAERA